MRLECDNGITLRDRIIMKFAHLLHVTEFSCASHIISKRKKFEWKSICCLFRIVNRRNKYTVYQLNLVVLNYVLLCRLKDYFYFHRKKHHSQPDFVVCHYVKYIRVFWQRNKCKKFFHPFKIIRLNWFEGRK